MNGMSFANRLFGGGLLSPELEDKLTEEQRRQLGMRAMLDAGLTTLANSGYSQQPMTTGQALALGLSAGRDSYAQNAQGFAEQASTRQQRERAAQAISMLPVDWQQYAAVVGPEKAMQAYQEQQGRLQLEKEKAKSKDGRTTLQKNLEAAGMQPGSPAYQDAINRATFMSKAPVTNVTVGSENAFNKAMATKDAETFAGWRDAAQSAGSTLAQLDVLDEINSLQQGGKIGEAAALVGQYFGTDASANYQTFSAVQKNLVLEQAKSLKGAMSDRDIQLLESTLPQFGNDPRANKVVIDILKRAAQRSIDNYRGADAHVAKTGGLRGYVPAINPLAPTIPTNAAKIDLDALSADEIQAELRRRGVQ